MITHTISGVGEAVDQVLVASERVHYTPITAVIHLQGRGVVGGGQGAVTPIDAVVSAATGVTMRSQGHGGF